MAATCTARAGSTGDGPSYKAAQPKSGASARPSCIKLSTLSAEWRITGWQGTRPARGRGSIGAGSRDGTPLDVDPRPRRRAAREQRRDQKKDEVQEDGDAHAHHNPEQAPREASSPSTPSSEHDYEEVQREQISRHLWSFLAKGHWQSVTGNDSPAEHVPVKE
jgi:hypothetical protein